MAPDIEPNAAAIRAARGRAGMTQAALAEVSGVSERTIRRLERGAVRTTNVQVIRALAAVLGVTASTLIEPREDPDRDAVLEIIIARLEQAVDRLERFADRILR